MLILTRRVGEALKIGDDVNVTVVGVKGNRVRLGIDAPRHVPVHRKEILDERPFDSITPTMSGAPKSDFSGARHRASSAAQGRER